MHQPIKQAVAHTRIHTRTYIHLQVDGQAVYILSWEIPSETGAGRTYIGGLVDALARQGQARNQTKYIAQAAVDGDYEAGDATFSIDTPLFAVKGNLIDAVIYHFRVAAINEVGQGPWGSGVTSGPQIESVTPSSGPTVGGIWVTVNGRRFGTAKGNIQVAVGDTRCAPIEMLQSDSQFHCRLAPGTGGPHTLFLEIIGLRVKVQVAFQYLEPQVWLMCDMCVE
jgi:hypothetical protein